MDLFQTGKFTSHAGLQLNWKIECDAISDDEWNCFASMIMEYEKRPFSKVVGIPRGGKKLEDALTPYATGGNHPILIVDDVWTTGTSFKEFTSIQLIEDDIKNYTWFGWCIFARTAINFHNVSALFNMPGNQNEA